MHQEKLWHYIQTEEPSRFQGSGPRLEYLVSRTPAVGRVLDIGIGGGQFEMAAIRAGRDIHALDQSEAVVERISRELGLGNKAKVGGVQAIPFEDEFFSCVVMSEVIEHLEDSILDRGLREVRRVLRRGGLFVGTVPARERLEDSAVYCPTCETTFHRWGHVRSFTVDTLRATLQPHFLVKDVREKLFVSWQTLNWRGKVAGAMQKVAARAGLQLSNANIVFVAERA